MRQEFTRKQRLVQCPQCGEAYHRTGNCQIYCSPKCRANFHARVGTARFFVRVAGKLEYDWGTGVLRWKRDDREVTSQDSDGYLHVNIAGKQYRAHRIAWLLHYGEWPSGIIDHINGNKADNRITNLRVVSFVENGQNRKLDARSKSGTSGVWWSPRQKAWKVYIRVNGRNIHLGYFKDKASAIAKRKAAEAENGYSPFHGRAA